MKLIFTANWIRQLLVSCVASAFSCGSRCLNQLDMRDMEVVNEFVSGTKLVG